MVSEICYGCFDENDRFWVFEVVVKLMFCLKKILLLEERIRELVFFFFDE